MAEVALACEGIGSGIADPGLVHDAWSEDVRFVEGESLGLERSDLDAGDVGAKIKLRGSLWGGGQAACALTSDERIWCGLLKVFIAEAHEAGVVVADVVIDA